MIKTIEELVRRQTQEEMYEKNSAKMMSETLRCSRNEVASFLNVLHHQNVIIKIESKPILYLHKAEMETKLQRTLLSVYADLPTLLTPIEKQGFQQLVGYEGSLKELVKQCKATISYPPNGLPMMLYGPTGTGKSHIAKVTYEYAKKKGLLAPEAKFVAVNCSEYANNPELLTANLFGHVKGAFTGADTDNPGLIALADGGVLFLDEVHNLKAECQEKLFQFMDQAIYHRVGDNEKWYQSNVRLIFATTENPEEVLLKTLQRRIVMTIHIPSLKERGIQERMQLLYAMFQAEEAKLNKKIKISMKVYNILLAHDFVGNIGGLKSCVQSCCVNSLFDINEEEEIIIRLASLPKYLLDEYANKTQADVSHNEYIKVEELSGFINKEKEIIRLNEALIQNYQQFEADEINKNTCLMCNKQAVRQYFDDILFVKQEVAKTNFYQNGVQHIFDLIADRYGLSIANNDLLAISHYLNNYHNDYHSFTNWSNRNQEVCIRFEMFMKDEFYHESSLSSEIAKYLESYLDMKIDRMVHLTILILLTSVAKQTHKRKKLGVILAHGFSTASSIADATNKFLSAYVFDAIDMPLNVDTNTIVQKLNAYLSRVGKFDELLLLVDMGSLEDIYKGLDVKKANVGIINNISTKAALEIGNGIVQDRAMEDIFKDVIKYTNTTYHIEKNRQKEDIILCSCASGMGTAEKLRGIIQDSLPMNSSILVKTYNYNELIEKGTSDAFFDDYHVLCVIGTLNPNIQELNFIPIEDLIINDSLDELDKYLEYTLQEDALMQFKKNILRNFSLSNIMNNLTILNPNKLLQHVADAIDRLQQALAVSFTNNTCFGLYVHISCMIERLVMQKEIEVYSDVEKFKEENERFITLMKQTFYEVEQFYGVQIPVAEIGYIYDYVKNDPRF